MSNQPGIIRRFFSALWSGITRLRVALSNLLFILFLVLLFALFSGRSPEPLPERAALILNPVGTIVEQKSWVDPMALLFSDPVSQEREVLLRDVIDAIRLAKDDPRITALVMELDQLFGMGISKTGEIAAAIAEFRESGKPVVAWGDSFSQGQYLLAAESDTVILHPMGAVILEGFSNYQWYFADALEKLSLNMHVFKAGDHKSVADPFQNNAMPAAEREISQRWLDSLWDNYTAGVERARELPAGAVDNYIENFSERLVAADGYVAGLAREAGLIDRLEYRNEANNWLAELVGATDDYGNYEGVEFEYYVERQRPLEMHVPGAPRVGVITARGMIYDGEQPAGSIGGDSLAALLQEAIDDEDIHALVLRVDSGGGSAFASEIIRRRLMQARHEGLPVVVSMGSIAASGGYWIAAPADEIWATPTTLTGSIGVFSAFPTTEELLAKMGIHTDGVATTSLAGGLRIDRPLKPEVATAQQAVVDNIYDRFVGLVADGREMEKPDVAAIAGGRVWSGEDAMEAGLIDELGGLDEAIASAAAIAGLDDYSVDYLDLPLSSREMLIKEFMGQSALGQAMVEELRGIFAPKNPLLQSVRQFSAPLEASLELIGGLNDPQGAYAHCVGCVAP
jgi:protease-4